MTLLELEDVQDRPALFSAFMMWMLARLQRELPEVGDRVEAGGGQLAPQVADVELDLGAVVEVVAPDPVDQLGVGADHPGTVDQRREHRELGRGQPDLVAADDGMYFLELNTLPGLTTSSLVPQELRAAGIDFRAFLEKQIELATT